VIGSELHFADESMFEPLDNILIIIANNPDGFFTLTSEVKKSTIATPRVPRKDCGDNDILD
jgi:hypothetical protein